MSPDMRNGKQRRAVITGLGPITCIGIGRKISGMASSPKKAASGASPASIRAFHAHCAGEIRDWMPEDFFPPHRLKRLDRYAQFAVASAKLALDDAGLAMSREKPQDRIGVSFGTALGGVCQAEDQHIRIFEERRSRREADACAPGLRRLRPLEHRD